MMVMRVEKRRHPRFAVPNYGAKSRKRLKPRWRTQRGEDNKKRRYWSGYGASPRIGYKNASVVRFARKDGALEVLVHNAAELLSVPRDGRSAAVLAHGLSRRTKLELEREAAKAGIRVINRVRS
jgi:ribosomal protein L32E